MTASPNRALSTPVPRLLGWGIILLSTAAALLLDQRILAQFFAGPTFSMPADLDCFRANGAWLGRHIATEAAEAASSCTFKYPPPFLLLAAPLSFVPPLAAFIGWSLASIAAFVAAGRALQFSWPVILLGLIAPPMLLSLTIGQSGIFLSLPLLLAFAWAGSAPLAAGFAAGFLVMKPQLGLIVPICYLAARNWRALGAMLFSAAALCLAATLCFGPSIWSWYLQHGAANSRDMLTAPWPQLWQHILISAYILPRALGAGLGASLVLQAVVSLAALLTAGRLWAAPAHPARLPLSLCLAALVTPYAYVYDLPALALALAAFAAAQGWRHMGTLAWFWAFTGCYIFIATFFAPPGIIGLAVLLALLAKFPETFCRDETGSS